jgi:hypothetical protein
MVVGGNPSSQNPLFALYLSRAGNSSKCGYSGLMAFYGCGSKFVFWSLNKSIAMRTGYKIQKDMRSVEGSKKLARSY